MVACRASILSLRSVSLTQINKKQLPVSPPVLYQIRTRFYRMHQCHVSVGRKEARGRATPGDFNCYTKIKVEKSCRVWHCVSVECFDSLNLTASKQPGRKNVDICCWKEKNCLLFNCYFCFYCDTGYLLFELCYFLKTWKDVDQRQDGYTGEKTVQVLFLGLLNYSLRSKACCIYNGYMSCLFYYFFFS